jgi:hypothetical protein
MCAEMACTHRGSSGLWTNGTGPQPEGHRGRDDVQATRRNEPAKRHAQRGRAPSGRWVRGLAGP